jgi:ribonuclease P protein component
VPSPLKFPKTRRLTNSAEFKRVREEGTVARGSLLSIGVLPGCSSEMRAGFVTSKRVGNAVVRNRVRRRLREIVRRHQHELLETVWVVTIARPSSGNATYAALEHEWLRLARRTSILAP